MAALTDHKQRFMQRPDLQLTKNMNVAASIRIFSGAIVCKDGSGNAINAPATGASIYQGFAEGGYDNSAVAAVTTGAPLLVRFGQLEQCTCDGAALTAADIGKEVFYIDSGTVSRTIVAGTGINESKVGIIHSIVTGNIIIVQDERMKRTLP